VIASAAVNVFATEDPGVPILTVDPIRLLAVTVNPVSYRGVSYGSAEMVRAVASQIERRTVSPCLYSTWFPGRAAEGA
jgi:hypothetical protein